MSADEVVKALRSRDLYLHPVDPKAVYRTRPVALYEQGADLIERQAKELAELQGELADMTRERDRWMDAGKDGRP